jgi:response regulator RpfG family c-di-GMP phosphodiesterase
VKAQFGQMRVLVVDDNATNLELVEQILARAGYTEVLSVQDAERAVQIARAWQPDLLMLDLHMPRTSGYELMEQIADLIAEPQSLPVLVVTADGTQSARNRALATGARDFISKPLDRTELLLRTHNLLQTRDLQLQLQQRNATLDLAVRSRTDELEQAQLESLALLAAVGEYHDDETHEHTQRVGESAARLARALDLPEVFVSNIRDAAPLHDIGKIGVSRSILRKPGALTEPERAAMKRHAEIGAQILAHARSPVLRLAAEIARSHHERWDGHGYPEGLAGEQIPIAGRITAVADVFDALTHQRPYKPAWDVERAVALIIDGSGGQFDADVVEAFTSLDPATLLDGPLARAA